MISLLLLMFKPISNYLQIISRQVQLIGGSQEPASSLHTPPSSFGRTASARPPPGEKHRRWGRKESSPQRVPKDFLTPSCPRTAGTPHSGEDSGWEKDSSSSSKVPGQGQRAQNQGESLREPEHSFPSCFPLPAHSGIIRHNSHVELHPAASQPPLDSTSPLAGFTIPLPHVSSASIPCLSQWHSLPPQYTN